MSSKIRLLFRLLYIVKHFVKENSILVYSIIKFSCVCLPPETYLAYISMVVNFNFSLIFCNSWLLSKFSPSPSRKQILHAKRHNNCINCIISKLRVILRVLSDKCHMLLCNFVDLRRRLSCMQCERAVWTSRCVPCDFWMPSYSSYSCKTNFLSTL